MSTYASWVEGFAKQMSGEGDPDAFVYTGQQQPPSLAEIRGQEILTDLFETLEFMPGDAFVMPVYDRLNDEIHPAPVVEEGEISYTLGSSWDDEFVYRSR